jgi:putative ATP-binding cassette transporter
MKETTRLFWRDFWALLRPFGTSQERWPMLGLLVIIVTLTLSSVYLSVQFNQWYNRFYNALDERSVDPFWMEILVFTGLATVHILVAVYNLYLNQALQIRLRRVMTNNLLDAWTSDRAYYRQQFGGGATDNPDQRIAEDIRLFVSYTLTLGLGLVSNIVSLVSFGVILWTLAGPVTFAIFGSEITIPQFMIWAAVLYAVIGTWLTHVVGRPLIGLNFNQQKVEADFRYGLIRFRENAEAVALERGEAGEKRGLLAFFGAVVANWYAIMSRQKKLTFLTAGYNQASVIFPFIVAAPQFFAGILPLGGLIQTSSAFGNVQDGLSWFINAYSSLTEWKATVDRLTGFRRAVVTARAEAQVTRIDVVSAPRTDLAIDVARLALPDGTTLVEAGGLSIARGDRVLVTGPSGAGKSTLFRALAGIWPFGEAKIAVPDAARLLFLPQRPYLPLGSLYDAVAYPAKTNEVPREAAAEALEAVRLGHLVPEIDAVDYWARRLSPGEQQRLAIARALLWRPDWLFLDEATSAVDEDTARHLFALLRERLPATTLVTVSHDTTIADFHDRHWRIEKRGAGPGRLVEAPLPA